METIWLQRSSPDVPWGFRLVGGREFNLPLSVQRVTPGSVAAAALGPGDVFLKVGNVVTSDLKHDDAMDLVRQAGNILQLTIQKGSGTPLGTPLSPEPRQQPPSFTPQYQTTPRGGSSNFYNSNNNNNSSNTHISSAHVTPNYSTTPRNYGSQHQATNLPSGMRIEIQRVAPSPRQPQQQHQQQQQQQQQQQRQPVQRSVSNMSDGPAFPDYTIGYKHTEPIHDSPGGPVDLRSPAQATSPYTPPMKAAPTPGDTPPYSSMSLPRGAHSNNNVRAGGPPSYAPPSYNSHSTHQPSFSDNSNNGFNAGVSKDNNNAPRTLFSPTPSSYSINNNNTANKSFNSTPQNFNSAPQGYNTTPKSYTAPFSPQPSSSPLSPKTNFGTREQEAPPNSNYYNHDEQPMSNTYGTDSYRGGAVDQSNIHGSGNNAYATLPHKSSTSLGAPTKPAAKVNLFNNSPKPFSPAGALSPPLSSSAATPAFNAYDSGSNPIKTATPARPFQPTPLASPGGSYQGQPSPKPYGQPSPQPYGQPQHSFDQSNDNNRPFSPRLTQMKSPTPDQYSPSPGIFSRQNSGQPASLSRQSSHQDPYSPRGYTSPSAQQASISRSNSQFDDVMNGVTSPTMSQPSYSRQPSYPASPVPYRPAGLPMSPMSPKMNGGQGYRGFEPSANVSYGMRPSQSMTTSPTSYNPPPMAYDPPPPPPLAPPPPPAPPIPSPGALNSNWRAGPARRSNQSLDGSEGSGQQVPDQLLNTMMQAQRGGGPKPFSYGIDMNELKKKMGPPTAPKPRGRRAQSLCRTAGEVQDVPRGPKKPAGLIQQDYFIKRDYDTNDRTTKPKRPAGQIQGDYFLNRDKDNKGPRGEIDNTSLSVNMGNNPKKQSKSFKILQWMTEVDKQEQEAEERAQEGEDGGMQASTSASPTPKEPAPKPARQRSRRPSREVGRHNADDDEMRFTGLHPKTDIPSKTFNRLKKMPSEEPAPRGTDTLDVGDDIGNYNESSIRYKGGYIPSPSFKVLNQWAEADPLKASSSVGADSGSDGLPDTLTSEEMTNVRYTGGNIPSKTFRTLQNMVGAGGDGDGPSNASNGHPTEDTLIVLETPVIAATKTEVSDF